MKKKIGTITLKNPQTKTPEEFEFIAAGLKSDNYFARMPNLSKPPIDEPVVIATNENLKGKESSGISITTDTNTDNIYFDINVPEITEKIKRVNRYNFKEGDLISLNHDFLYLEDTLHYKANSKGMFNRFFFRSLSTRLISDSNKILYLLQLTGWDDVNQIENQTNLYINQNNKFILKKIINFPVITTPLIEEHECIFNIYKNNYYTIKKTSDYSQVEIREYNLETDEFIKNLIINNYSFGSSEFFLDASIFNSLIIAVNDDEPQLGHCIKINLDNLQIEKEFFSTTDQNGWLLPFENVICLDNNTFYSFLVDENFKISFVTEKFLESTNVVKSYFLSNDFNIQMLTGLTKFSNDKIFFFTVPFSFDSEFDKTSYIYSIDLNTLQDNQFITATIEKEDLSWLLHNTFQMYRNFTYCQDTLYCLSDFSNETTGEEFDVFNIWQNEYKYIPDDKNLADFIPKYSLIDDISGPKDDRNPVSKTAVPSEYATRVAINEATLHNTSYTFPTYEDLNREQFCQLLKYDGSGLRIKNCPTEKYFLMEVWDVQNKDILPEQFDEKPEFVRTRKLIDEDGREFTQQVIKPLNQAVTFGEWKENALKTDIPKIENTLTSNSPTAALSAAQGKVLDEKITNISLTPGPPGEPGISATNTTFFNVYVKSNGDLMAVYPEPVEKSNLRLDSDGNLYFITDPNIIGAEFLLGNARGLQGLQGPQGEQGPPGPVNIEDNLTSTSTTAALSAAQGKKLNESKLNLTGGIMSGPITLAAGDGQGLLFKDRTSNININEQSQTKTLVGFLNDTFTIGHPSINTTVRGAQTYITGNNLDIGNTGNSGLIAKGISTNTDYTTIHTQPGRALFIQEGNSGTVNIGGTPSTTAAQDLSAKLIINGDTKTNNIIVNPSYNISLSQIKDPITNKTIISSNNVVNEFAIKDSGKAEIKVGEGAIEINETDAGSTEINHSTFLSSYYVSAEKFEENGESLSDKYVSKKGDIISGNLTVSGDLTVQGKQTILDTETISTKDNIISLASGRGTTTPITGPVGLEVANYKGTDKTGQLVFKNDGIAYVGDSDDLQPLATRDTEANMTTNKFVKWDSTSASLKTTKYGEDDIPEVVNNLTSTSTTAALSAMQGKILNSNKVSNTGGILTGDYFFNNKDSNTNRTTSLNGASIIIEDNTNRNNKTALTVFGVSSPEFTEKGVSLVNKYQAKLIGTQTTGQNIKTINGISLLGTGNISTTEVINNLTSTSITSALSAAQGKILNDSKMPITGGTFTGTVSFGAGSLNTNGNMVCTHLKVSSIDAAQNSNAFATVDSGWIKYRNKTDVKNDLGITTCYKKSGNTSTKKNITFEINGSTLNIRTS